MANVFDNLMAPLGKEHCTIYYVLGLASLFIAALLALVGVSYIFDKKNRQMSLVFISNSLGMLFTYYLYRITYSMCVRSL